MEKRVWIAIRYTGVIAVSEWTARELVDKGIARRIDGPVPPKVETDSEISQRDHE